MKKLLSILLTIISISNFAFCAKKRSFRAHEENSTVVEEKNKIVRTCYLVKGNKPTRLWKIKEEITALNTGKYKIELFVYGVYKTSENKILSIASTASDEIFNPSNIGSFNKLKKLSLQYSGFKPSLKKNIEWPKRKKSSSDFKECYSIWNQITSDYFDYIERGMCN